MTFWIFITGAFGAGWVCHFVYHHALWHWPNPTEEELAWRSDKLDREIIEYYGGQEKFDEWCRSGGRHVGVDRG